MKEDFKIALLQIVRESSEELINGWLSYFDDKQKDSEYRHYDDFLGFFEECIESDLDSLNDDAEALKHFLTKIQEIIGKDAFFHFHDSVYTCFLKFPILKLMSTNNLFVFENVATITKFFESITSQLIISLLQKHNNQQKTSIEELAEREAPISEILEGVLMVAIVGTLDSHRILKIIDKVLHEIEKKELTSVIVDISAIFDMNSEVANQIIKLNNTIHYMGVTPYLSGITSNIAKSLTHLNINLGDVHTYATTKKVTQIILEERV